MFLVLTMKVYVKSFSRHSVMLHAAETLAMTMDTPNHLWLNDCAMICWICNVKAQDEVSSDTLLPKLGIQSLNIMLRTSRMRHFRHDVESSTDWIAKFRKLKQVARKRSGRPKKTLV